MIAARSTFVFSKAHALAKRIPIEQDKRIAAHTVCERLVALLALGQSPSPLVSDKQLAAASSSLGEPVKGTPQRFPLAGNAHLDIPLGCGVRA